MANYTVTVAMDEKTVKFLLSHVFYLYGLKAVKCPRNGAPLVWFRSQRFSRDTTVQWEARYRAYTSRSSIVPNATIQEWASYDIEIDQTLNVTSRTGTGVVDTIRGVALAISIMNKTSDQFTCGISQLHANGWYAPMCAFNLSGHKQEIIAPTEKVFLMFSTDTLDIGTVVMQAKSPGLLIDLTGAPGNQRTVTYDLHRGWSWADGASWAREYPSNTNLVPLLIQSSSASRE